MNNSPTKNLQYKSYKSVINTVPDVISIPGISSRDVIKHTRVNVTQPLLVTKVHINPNFQPQNVAMHINPKICAKPAIHVNPKMVHDIASSNQDLQNNLMGTIKTHIDSKTEQTNVKRSIYVNPTLLKKLPSSAQDNIGKLRTERQCIKAMPVKSINNRKVKLKMSGNSDVLLMSRRKLVRVARTTPETSAAENILQKPVNITEVKPISQKTTKIPLSDSNTLHCTKYTSPKSNSHKSKVTKYKIDRTVNTPKIKKESSPVKRTKIVNNNVNLREVTIRGILYKVSKNRLIRRNIFKRKRSVNGDKFITTKKIRNKANLSGTVETNTSKIRRSPNISIKDTYKNNIRNKVKQRSIQILRDKMHMNNKPCLIFQRFGYCQNYKDGICRKRHDKKQVSICKRFLQGKCLLDNCPLSHDVGPEKMPTCKYFLDGCCTRDACPYLHVKVSSNTSICIDFLQGYCVKGNECQRRHEYLCPEFDKSGDCSKGKYCPYPHKSHSSNVVKDVEYPSKKSRKVHEHQMTSSVKNDTETSNAECNLRYYERTDDSSDHFEKKKENILRKIEIMKKTLNNDPTNDITKPINETNISLIEENEGESVMSIKNRPPIGSLPAYIPFD